MVANRGSSSIFSQGSSLKIRLILAVGIAIGLMQADHFLQISKPLRQGLSVVLYPVAGLLAMPAELAMSLVERGQSLATLAAETEELRRIELLNAAALLEAEQLRQENASLRSLLSLRARLPLQAVAAELHGPQRDPAAHRVLISRGQDSAIFEGHPVMTPNGVLGQVSRVLPLSAEVRLLTDPQFSMPVLLPRTGTSAITRGTGTFGQFDLQYVNVEADIRAGDLVVSSGLDGIYPAGLPVGVVVSVSQPRLGKFPQVVVRPAASLSRQKQVLVLLAPTGVESIPSRTPAAAVSP